MTYRSITLQTSSLLIGLLLASSAQAELRWNPKPPGAHNMAQGGHGGHSRRGPVALYLDDSEAAELQMWSSTLQLSELEQLEGKVELTKTGIDNYHAVLATRSSQTLHESALRYRYMRGKPSGHSPSELTALTKTPLEIVPDPLPREHWRYTGNQTANFTITFNGEPLAGAWVGLTSSNGTTLESTSDAEGSVSFPVPDDFSRVMPGHSNNPKGEFIVRTGHVDNGRLYRTNLTADYRVDPGHWQSNGVALFMLGGGFAAGLLVTRRRNDAENKKAKKS
ncbi:hypothetical protein BOW53_00580 [Solemya pervernicosa gill symbiont]|uniref:Uncharacterized protein n=1 Tax=Solemya pervernicosa gill symbiont TaxID=642797 RepID=A0A1T2LBQ1_9GAMM|nr:hypothetical protein [Solemya pervernicosa gill symbiont]OOZ42366.1 hypothetical protein BOW53_00580 [Solemya pervernicosa gill symbiont]